MKHNFIGEVIISSLLILLLIFFLHPFALMMPQSMHIIMIPLLVILFVIFAGLFWKETPGDERESLHKLIASRFAYFAGVVVLIAGIIIQSMQKAIDPWLIVTICVILLAKLVGLIYGHTKL